MLILFLLRPQRQALSRHQNHFVNLNGTLNQSLQTQRCELKSPFSAASDQYESSVLKADR